MKEHKYAKYRPEWCKHPPFNGIDYCWGLALAVDNGTPKENIFFEDKCKTCDMSDYYEET
jgi:hypothetical protein